MFRMLNSAKDGIVPPEKLYVYVSEDGSQYTMARIQESPCFPNDRHDAYVDCVLTEGLDAFGELKKIKVVFRSQNTTYMDDVIINP